MKVKLSKSVVNSSREEECRTLYLWDTEQIGFGLRITETGAKSYVFSYSLAGWRSPRRLTIGPANVLTLDQARVRARELRGQVLVGIDPAVEVEDNRNAPTVRDLIDRFLADHVEAKLRKTTARAYRQVLTAPPAAFLNLRVDEVTGDHVARLHTSMRNRPFQANRLLAVMRKMFALAERWHLRGRGTNPATGHDPYPERKDRGSRASDEELARVGEALRYFETGFHFEASAVPMLRFNMLTGWRPIEVRNLQWEDVDLERRVVCLREAKTGTRSGFLGKPAADLLRSLPLIYGNPYCFPGRDKGKPLDQPAKLWNSVRHRAALPTRVRYYDLVRHTFNTVAQEVGVPPEMVQVLVGHVPMTISARYTHFALARTLEAADLAAEAIWERMGGGSSIRSQPRATGGPAILELSAFTEGIEDGQ